MNVLILGSGGREHALAWKIAKSPLCRQVFVHPGNAGMRQTGLSDFGTVSVDDASALIERAQQENISLIIIGPEALLAKGHADAFRKAGFAVHGPDAAAAQLETSKVYAKQFMQRAQIPTASFEIAKSAQSLKQLMDKRKTWPAVLKLDGLAAGKGVSVVQSKEQALEYADKIWNQNTFGQGPHQVIVEEFLPGKEISYIGLTDGKQFVALETATDHKRAYENDEGPNTGGMGCLCPSPYMSDELQTRIQERIIQPVLQQWQKESTDYRGTLYVGLMIDEDQNPFVVEFNARFGDPETQVTMLQLESDLLPLLDGAARGKLGEVTPPRWSQQKAAFVVAAAQGYPENVRKGDYIEGLDSLGDSVTCFFAGVKEEETRLLTSGGRVLGIGAQGGDFESACQKVYQSLENIRWEGMHYRKDIGRKKK